MFIAFQSHVEFVRDRDTAEDKQQDVADEHRIALVHLTPVHVFVDVVYTQDQQQEVPEDQNGALCVLDKNLTRTQVSSSIGIWDVWRHLTGCIGV